MKADDPKSGERGMKATAALLTEAIDTLSAAVELHTPDDRWGIAESIIGPLRQLQRIRRAIEDGEL